MAIPDYQTLMLPLLRLADTGSEHRVSDTVETLSNELRLSDAERAELLPSGRQPVFNNRVHWAKTYLSQAKLLEITRRGYFKITQRGLDVLRDQPKRIGVDFLERFEEFREFKVRTREAQRNGTSFEPKPVEDKFFEIDTLKISTPDEVVRATVRDIEAVLAGELLDRILAAPPVFFENLIVTLLLSMGYGGSREEAGRAYWKERRWRN